MVVSEADHTAIKMYLLNLHIQDIFGKGIARKLTILSNNLYRFRIMSFIINLFQDYPELKL